MTIEKKNQWLESNNDIAFSFSQQDESEIGLQGNGQLWTLGVGLLFTAVAAAYVTRLAKVMIFYYWYGVWTSHTYIMWQFTNEIPGKRRELTGCISNDTSR